MVSTAWPEISLIVATQPPTPPILRIEFVTGLGPMVRLAKVFWGCTLLMPALPAKTVTVSVVTFPQRSSRTT